MERVAKKSEIRLRVENGQPVPQPGIKFYNGQNFENVLPLAANLMCKKMNEVNWRESPWGLGECEQALRNRFERSNHHTPAIAYETPDGALKSIIFPTTWKRPSLLEGARFFWGKSRIPRIRIRLFLRKEMHTVRKDGGNAGNGILSRLREGARLFWNESRAPLQGIISILREGALTLWFKLPSTWKMGFDEPWQSDRPDGTHIFCSQVFADGGPREVIHGGVIPILLERMMTGSKRTVGVAYSRFSDLAKHLGEKMNPRRYIEGIIRGEFADRIIRMHLNYGAVHRKTFKKGCDDPHSLYYSVLMDYTPLVVFVAASLKDDAIKSTIIAKFGKKYGDVVKLAKRLDGTHVTVETCATGTDYVIDYSPFLEMMNGRYLHKPARSEKMHSEN